MEWFLLALIGPVLWGMSNIVDKWLLLKYFRSPFSYQVLIGLSNIVALPILLLAVPISFDPIIVAAALSLGTFATFVYVLYNKALMLEETTRIISLMQLTPLLILPFAILFLGEIVSTMNYLGVFLLVAGGVLVSYKKGGWVRGLSLAVGLIILWDIIWAGFGVTEKWTLGFVDVWSFTFWMTVGAIVGGLLMLAIPKIRKDFIADARGFDKKVYGFRGLTIATYFIGIIAFYFALSIGPVSLVAAIPAVQPAIVLCYVLLLHVFLPKYPKEDMSKNMLLIKLLAIVLIFIGTWAITA